MNHESWSDSGVIILETKQPETRETQREQFFVPVSLQHNKIFCGDDREPIGLEEDFIHVFGGALFIPYNLMILGEATRPGSANTSFKDEVSRLSPIICQAAHAQYSVHSDTAAEHGEHFQLTKKTGKVGCGYAELRAVISAAIANRPADTLADAMMQRPELFLSADDERFGNAVIGAHGRLAKRHGCFEDGGRAVVLAAIQEGSSVMLVDGGHEAEGGIINLRRNTSLRSGEALHAGLPAYNHDSWAVEDTFDDIKHLTPYSKQQFQIASLIDATGTMRALGVKDIMTRR